MNELSLEDLRILETSLILFSIMIGCQNCRKRAREMTKDIIVLIERKEQELKTQEE